MFYTLRDCERELGQKTTLQLVDILRTNLKLGTKSSRRISSQVDKLIHKDLLSTLLLLYGGPNTRVLINHKLPPEILTTIFGHVRLQPCTRDTPGTSVWNPVVLRMDSLVRLSHVCRFWRDIILGTRILWDRIQDPRRRLARVEIPYQRAQGMPLILSIQGEPTSPMKLLLNGPRSIREIRYDGITIALSQQHLQEPAPLLENLSLSGSPGRTSPGHSRRPSGGFHVQIFRGQTPRLRRLSLDSLHWLPTLDTSTLTHLHLADCYGRNLLQRILLLLSTSPNLTELVLVDREDVLYMQTSQDPILAVQLRRMRRLVFKNMSSSGAKLILSHVRLTPETCVRMVEVQPLGAELLDQLSQLPVNASITKLLIKGAGTRCTVVGEGDSAGIMVDRFTAENQEWDTALPRILPMNQLRELHIVLRDSPALFASTPTAIFGFLTRAPALERLYVDTQGLASLLDAIECYGPRSLKLACPDVTLHVQMPCREPGSSVHMLQSFAIRQTNLGIRHLVAEYCSRCQGGGYRPWFPRDVQVNFASLTCTPRSCAMGHEWRMLRMDWPAC